MSLFKLLYTRAYIDGFLSNTHRTQRVLQFESTSMPMESWMDVLRYSKYINHWYVLVRPLCSGSNHVTVEVNKKAN